MPNARTVLAVVEANTAKVVSRFEPVASLPVQVRARIVEGALAMLLLALGVVIGKTIAWLVIGIALVVLAVMFLSGLGSSQRNADVELGHRAVRVAREMAAACEKADNMWRASMRSI